MTNFRPLPAPLQLPTLFMDGSLDQTGPDFWLWIPEMAEFLYIDNLLILTWCSIWHDIHYFDKFRIVNCELRIAKFEFVFVKTIFEPIRWKKTKNNNPFEDKVL